MARPEETRHLVNETTNSPEESDDRAGVTTGQQAASNDDAARTDVSPVRATGNGAGAERASDRPPRPAPAAGKGRKGARGANQAAAENGRETGPTAAGKGGEATSPGSGSTAAGNGRPEAAAAANLDGPTARLRLPKASNGAAAASGSAAATPKPAAAPAPPPDPAPPRSAPVNPTSGSGGSSAPASSQAGAPTESIDPGAAARAPASPAGPVTGPIPTPGAAAASPPPWNRVPGRSPQPSEQPPTQSQGPAGGLLDDGPTAYLMPDSGPTSDAAEPQVRSWSPMRAGRARPPRRAALQLKRLDPWSMLKLGLVLAVVIFFIWLVAVGVLYGVLDGMGVWDRLNGTYADLVSGEAPTGSPLISAGRVFGLAAVIGAINSLLFAVAMTIGAFVYNVSADLVGGVEVTLSERD
jgi:hypothetical protein